MFEALKRKRSRVFIVATWLCLSFTASSQCTLTVHNPACQPAGPVDLTAAAVTAGTANLGTLTYWANLNATVPLGNPAAVFTPGRYYIKNTVGGCTDIQPVDVSIGSAPPTSNNPFLRTQCDNAGATATSVWIDWQNGVGESGFTYSYQIDGGPPVTGVLGSGISSMTIPGLSAGQIVTFTIVWNGLCQVPKTRQYMPKTDPVFAAYPDNVSMCPGATLPNISDNGLAGTWNPTTVTQGLHTYTFTPTIQCGNALITHINGQLANTPTFNAIGPLCQNDAPPTLPTTSTNGISGTWNVATAATTAVGTTQYTFTPNAASFPCSPQVTMSVQVTAPVNQPNFGFANNVQLCSGATSGVPVLGNTSTNGYSGSWSPSTVSTTTGQTYTFTPDPGQCAKTFTLNVTIVNKQTIAFNNLPSTGVTIICQGSTPPNLKTLSDNTIPVSGTWSPSSINMSLVDQDVTYTFTAAPGECVTSPTYQAVIHVNSLQTPHFAALQNLSYCEDTAPVAVLSTSSDEGYIGTWTPSQIDNTQTRNYVFHPAANQCASDVTINVRIDPKLTPHFDPIAPFCAGSVAPALPPSSNDTPPVTGTWSPPTIDNDAVGTLPYHFTPDPGQCYKEIDLNVTVTAPEDPGFDNIVFCENAVPVPALPTVSPNGYAGTWNPATIDPANIADEYIFTPDAGQCANPQSIQVTENLLTLTDATWTVSNFFEDGTIEILAVDAGNYLYQLNSGPLQESSIFTHVPPGVYSFTVYDANGCADPITKVDVVRIIGYPKFFTPNGDGNNDTWNIADLRNVGQSQAPIRIFDRYGKLLKQISAGGEGWDGTYNGQPLPSTDYWFVVQYEENGQQLEFKAHFALKR